MSIETLRALEKIHGHLGWLTVVALLHPAILLRNPHRRAATSVILATVLTTLVSLLGAGIYPLYRKLLRTSIFRISLQYGFAFERKEHLAIMVVCLAWAGCLMHLGFYRRYNAQFKTHVILAKCAHWSFVLAALGAFGVANIGTMIAIVRSF